MPTNSADFFFHIIFFLLLRHDIDTFLFGRWTPIVRNDVFDNAKNKKEGKWERKKEGKKKNTNKLLKKIGR